MPDCVTRVAKPSLRPPLPPPGCYPAPGLASSTPLLGATLWPRLIYGVEVTA